MVTTQSEEDKVTSEEGNVDLTTQEDKLTTESTEGITVTAQSIVAEEVTTELPLFDDVEDITGQDQVTTELSEDEKDAAEVTTQSFAVEEDKITTESSEE